MYPIWIAAFFGAILAAYIAVDVPKKEAEAAAIAADISATNFMAYRRSVQRYMEANPSASGTIADSTLGAYWLPGYVRNTSWTNLISGGTLYVYSTTSVVSGTLEVLHKKSPRNLLVGTKNASGHLQSYNGLDTGIVLPVGIPSNAIVMMGQ